MTQLAEDLLNAYKTAIFRVYADKPFDLKIGELSEPLLELHNTEGVNCSAFITACNPYSKQREPHDNENLQEQLAAAVVDKGLSMVDGLGCDSKGEWPDEASFLIPGCTLELSKALGDQFEQNAVVWIAASAIPELVVLR